MPDRQKAQMSTAPYPVNAQSRISFTAPDYLNLSGYLSVCFQILDV